MGRTETRAAKVRAGMRAGMMAWAGPGTTAFAIGGAGEGTRLLQRVRDADSLREDLGIEKLPPGDAVDAVAEYFRGGGSECTVLLDPRLGGLEGVGDDAGPGFRSGVYTIARMDAVSTVVLPGPSSALREGNVIQAAERCPDVLFILEVDSPDWKERGRKLFLPRRNAAFISAGPGASGALAAHLEAADFVEAAPYRRRDARPPRGIEPADCFALYRWRREKGLRRAIDLGTRWVVFELSHPFLWAGVEREVMAFLHRLRRLGFFSGIAEEALRDIDFDVACGPLSGPEAGEVSHSRVGITVEARAG